MSLSDGLIKRTIAEHTDLIIRIIDKETQADFNPKLGWEYSDVQGDPMTLYQLFRRKFLKQVYNSRSAKGYVLADSERTQQFLEEYSGNQILEALESNTDNPLTLPPDFLDIIIGYDDIKHIIRLIVERDADVHPLFVGPPASAKSLFLMEIERLGARMAFGGASTKIGLREIFFENPRYLVLDEINKIQHADDLSDLLSVMENQRLILHKHGTHQDHPVHCTIFGACNRLTKLTEELLSRFTVFHLKPYSREQYEEICYQVLTQREQVCSTLARYISTTIADQSRDVRDAIKVARLAQTQNEAKIIIHTLNKYRRR